MASETEYSNMWIDMWKDGIAPGQASSTVVTDLGPRRWIDSVPAISAMSGLACSDLIRPERLQA